MCRCGSGAEPEEEIAMKPTISGDTRRVVATLRRTGQLMLWFEGTTASGWAEGSA